MKLRSFFNILAAGVLALLLVSGFGFYWLIARSPLTVLGGGAVTNPSAAIFVPKQAPIAVSLLVNPAKLEALRLLEARPQNRGRSRTELNQIKSSLLANTGLDYQRDIEPWLGDEVTFAITSVDRDRDKTNGQQPGYLLVATTRNAKAARELLEIYWQKQAVAGADLIFEPYKGVDLIYTKIDPDLKLETKEAILQNSLATAVVGSQYVLFANHPTVLKAALNDVQAPELNLSSTSAYQQAIEDLQNRRIALAFLNLPQLKAWVETPSTPPAPKSNRSRDKKPETQEPSPQVTPNPAFESLAVALAVSQEGIFAQTALLAAPDRPLTAANPVLSAPVPALQYVPESSSLVAAGKDLEQFWSQLQAGLAGYDRLAALVNQPLTELERRWGLDLKQDIFSWVRGEYALGLLPRSDLNRPDWIFVAQKSAGAADAIADLDDRAKRQGYSIGSFNLGDRQISVWTKLMAVPTGETPSANGDILKAQVQGAHTTVDNYEIFATSIEALDRAINAPKQGSLLASRAFKESIAPLPATNDGYLYLDWVASQQALEQQLPLLKFVELTAKPLFDHLRSLVVSSSGSNSTERFANLFFKLS